MLSIMPRIPAGWGALCIAENKDDKLAAEYSLSGQSSHCPKILCLLSEKMTDFWPEQLWGMFHVVIINRMGNESS